MEEYEKHEQETQYEIKGVPIGEYIQLLEDEYHTGNTAKNMELHRKKMSELENLVNDKTYD